MAIVASRTSEGVRQALLCEDNPERREGIGVSLTELGYKVWGAPNPTEAISWLRHSRHEVVIGAAVTFA